MADGQVFNSGNVSFMSSYLQAKKATDEKPVQILWTTILGTWFPPSGPYKLAFKSSSLASVEKVDGVVIEVRFLGTGSITDPGQILENQIFIVECNGSHKDTHDRWHNAAVQLTHYLENNTNGTDQLFGAIAIGTKVEVYQWEYHNGSSHLHRIHDDQLDLGSARDRCTFEAAMDNARTQGRRSAVRDDSRNA
ncbi:uncharacterized protein NECHADRAFT_99095 [Fusarium vanettenii 77-13-4]|uniref:Uncharacterized protein n=1 Tax=Fusarium vanettenii (strain ATCC MYA-4622 / CBS 123669 / FGSC 9596 / NRRL 45880 / 77-13-4) TaxID=660122 RepID=C7Z6A7_FUSV7|nr:uncharacterized protein NECHADRAFT_99095 [Fusarium vanettenii 77-13-4]EEU40095.1 hypothetical protein NECHADRAFT_99095 [Fusarium vanettenii 77-13-4]